MSILGFSRLCFAGRAHVFQSYCQRKTFCSTVKRKVGFWRGLGDIFPAGSEEEAKEVLKEKQCVYAGFDPTADSLHVGHLVVLVNLLQWQRAGHQVVIVLGGATAMIGDPTGRNLERDPMQNEIVHNNLCKMRENIETIFNNGAKYYDPGKQTLLPPIILNNLDWYKDQSAISFMRNFGNQCRMGTMLLRSSVQTRLQSDTMSLKEFMYQLYQAYDWLHLLRRYNCRFQVGGADQTGNIVAGHDLISRMQSDTSVYGLTMPLLLSDKSKKMGKTGSKTVWLSPQKSRSFELHSYIMALNTFPINMLLNLFTLFDRETRGKIVQLNKDLSYCKYGNLQVADFVTRLCHGEEGIEEVRTFGALSTSSSHIFLQNFSPEQLAKFYRVTTIVDLPRRDHMSVLEVAMKANCFLTENDAKLLMSLDAFYINNRPVKSWDQPFHKKYILQNGATVLSVAGKVYHVVRWT